MPTQQTYRTFKLKVEFFLSHIVTICYLRIFAVPTIELCVGGGDDPGNFLASFCRPYQVLMNNGTGHFSIAASNLLNYLSRTLRTSSKNISVSFSSVLPNVSVD
jgi:hypothetical protein